MRNVLVLALPLMAAACAVPELPPEDPRDAPRGSTAHLKAHGTEAGEVTLLDLAAAHGLEVKIDKVTGRRILENEAPNKVIVQPGARLVTINGVDYPLLGEIRWKDGAIVFPGDARVIFGEHLKKRPIPEVSEKDFAYLDGLDESAPKDGPAPIIRRAAAPSPTQNVKIDPNAPPLPASWKASSRRHWEYIVIHHSATRDGSAKAFNSAHLRRGWENGLGYHFVIGNGSGSGDGLVEVGSRWLQADTGIDGAHAGVKRFNQFGIGICLVGEFDHEQPTPKQLAALRNLVRHLMTRYGISRDHILGHSSVKSGHTDCPGKRFPFEAFIRSL